MLFAYSEADADLPPGGIGKPTMATVQGSSLLEFASHNLQEVGGRLEERALTAALVRRCVDGDTDAWERLVRQYSRRIYGICYRFTGSATAAEDLSQEVFIKVYRTLGSYDLARGSFNTWITTVSRNLLVDHFRRSRQERLTDSLETSEKEDAPTLGERIEDQGASPDTHLDRRETRDIVQEALTKISPDLREAVILRDLQDMDYKEIAEILKVPTGTVKSRINRGRTELARVISRTKRQGT